MHQSKINNLKFDTIFDGICKCLRNAQELCDESEILHTHGKFARSYALSHLAREEFGKCFMLSRILIDVSAGIKVDWKKLNRRFRSHDQKIINDAAISTALFGQEWKKLGLPLDSIFIGIDFKNNRKNSCLYTDWQDGAFALPSDIITKRQSERNLSLAIYRVTELGPQLLKLEGLKSISKKQVRAIYPEDMFSDLDLDKFLESMSRLKHR